MRATAQNTPGHRLGQGGVACHTDARVAGRGKNLGQFGQADQDFFAGLRPMAVNVDPDDGDFLDRDPGSGIERVRVLDEQGVRATALGSAGHAAGLDRRGGDAPRAGYGASARGALAAAWRAPATPVARGSAADSYEVKPVGKPDAGDRHVRFDERGRETG